MAAIKALLFAACLIPALLLRPRRMFGLYAFFYACWQFMTFVWFDHGFDAAEIAEDVLKRPFVTALLVAGEARYLRAPRVRGGVNSPARIAPRLALARNAARASAWDSQDF